MQTTKMKSRICKNPFKETKKLNVLLKYRTTKQIKKGI